MKTIFIFLILVTLLNSQTITGFSSDSIATDSSAIITGTSFGSNALDIEWLGGGSGNIEQGTEGADFSKTDWSTLVLPVQYDDQRAHSGSQSIISDTRISSDGRRGYGYDTGGDIDSIYISWWVYWDIGTSTIGQWKMFRINWENNVSDTWPEIPMFNHLTSGQQYIIRRGSGDYTGLWLDETEYPVPGSWMRIELYYVASSGAGVADGELDYWLHRPDVDIQNPVNRTNEITYSSGESRRWRYLQFQNYQGNGLSGATGSRVWNDDVYISKGTQARVEIGDNSVWANCTHREIQAPTAWAAGEITVTFNQGSFDVDDNVWLFVVNADGDVSPGYAIIIGGEGSGEAPATGDGSKVDVINIEKE